MKQFVSWGRSRDLGSEYIWRDQVSKSVFEKLCSNLLCKVYIAQWFTYIDENCN